MLLNLSDVLTSEGKTRQLDVPMELECFESRLGSFPILRKSDIHFELTNIGSGKARMEGRFDLVADANCDRCLTEMELPLEVLFDRIVIAPDVVASEEEDTLEPDFMEGYQLDVEAFVYHEVLVNWPVKILCTEECKGVCPVCGKNLNMGECDCDTFVPDPRMAVINEIFKRDKEV